jgi:DNA-directed RNA polymerase specialized sigma24 family protein
MMKVKNRIAEFQIKAGNRYYFIDLMESVSNSKYVTISESKRVGDDIYERHEIKIFEEDLDKVIHTLTIVSKSIKGDSEKEKSRMQITKEKFAKAYSLWSEVDDDALTELYCAGMTTKEISKQMERNEGAINSRIRKLELKEKYGLRN